MSKAMTIEEVVYGGLADDPACHRQIEGYCGNIPASQVAIGFNIGNYTKWLLATHNGCTGFVPPCCIMIAEVAASQKVTELERN